MSETKHIVNKLVVYRWGC